MAAELEMPPEYESILHDNFEQVITKLRADCAIAEQNT
jgi:hypothetical protein